MLIVWSCPFVKEKAAEDLGLSQCNFLLFLNSSTGKGDETKKKAKINLIKLGPGL